MKINGTNFTRKNVISKKEFYKRVANVLKGDILTPEQKRLNAWKKQSEILDYMYNQEARDIDAFIKYSQIHG